MIRPSTGLVIRYNYLWARQFEHGEESGRKARPVCVQIVVEDERNTLVALFPISTQSPMNRTALEIPEMEARRVGLRIPTWVIVDEWNLDDLAVSPHVADVRPLGSFSPAFVKRIRAAAAECIKARKYRSVTRQ